MDTLIQWHASVMDVDRIPTILAAILLTIIIGMITGPRNGNASPFTWLLYDVLFGKIGERLDRKHRKQADLMLRGFILTIIGLSFALMIGKGFDLLAEIYGAGGLTQILLLSFLMSTGAIWFALLRLYFAMDQDKVSPNQVTPGAYYAIARTTRKNLAAGDDYGISRAAMALAARSFDKGLIAPALWFLIAGFPAAMIYSALAALSWRFGKDGFHSGFAAIPMALERLMGFIPSLFAALLLTAAASLTPTARLHKGIAAWLGQKDRAAYEQGGFPLSALAWSLNISLGGAAQDITGSAIKGAWVGPKTATAQIDHKHLRRGIYINVIAHLLFIAALLGAYLWGSITLS